VCDAVVNRLLHVEKETPFSVHDCADPTWTKTAPRKRMQFTWKRNGSNHGIPSWHRDK